MDTIDASPAPDRRRTHARVGVAAGAAFLALLLLGVTQRSADATPASTPVAPSDSWQGAPTDPDRGDAEGRGGPGSGPPANGRGGPGSGPPRGMPGGFAPDGGAAPAVPDGFGSGEAPDAGGAQS